MKTLILTQSDNKSKTNTLLNLKVTAITLIVAGVITLLITNNLILASTIILFGFPLYLLVKYCKEILSIVTNIESMFEDLEDVVNDLSM